MAQGNFNPSEEEYKKQLLEDLTAFRQVPNFCYHLPERDPSTYKLDLVTSWVKYFPFLAKTLWSVRPQAKEAFPISQQCFSDFIFQRSPYRIEECGYDIPTLVAPGIDYIASYWISVLHGFISLDQ